MMYIYFGESAAKFRYFLFMVTVFMRLWFLTTMLHSNTVYTLRLIFDDKSTFIWNGWNEYMFHVWMCVSVKRRKF